MHITENIMYYNIKFNVLLCQPYSHLLFLWENIKSFCISKSIHSSDFLSGKAENDRRMPVKKRVTLL